MKEKLKSVFLKDITNWKFWLLMAFIIKGIFFFLRVIQGSDDIWVIHGFLGNITPDTRSYIEPIDNLLSSGSYGSATRLPGYGFIYLFFRLFASKAIACNLVIVLQYVMASISVYSLALLVHKITGIKYLFYAVFYLFLISSYSNYMDGALMTESLCTSLLIFSTFYIVNYFQQKKLSSIFISGALLTAVIFLRPVFLIVFIIYCLLLVIKTFRLKLPVIKALIIFASTFIITDGLWIVRNYRTYKKIIPLAPTVWRLTDWQTAAINFIQSWGGNIALGESKGVIFWFGYHNGYIDKFDGSSSPFPDNIYNSTFNKDSLLKLKAVFISLQDSASINSPVKDSRERKLLIAKFNEYAESIRREHPTIYYVKAPLIYAKGFFTFSNASYNVMGYSAYHKGIFNAYNNVNYTITKWFKVNPVNWLYVVFNYIILTLGVFGILLLAVLCFKKFDMLFIITIPVYTILIHPFVLRLGINRYLMPAWPFIIVCAAYLIMVVTNRNNKLPGNEKAE